MKVSPIKLIRILFKNIVFSTILEVRYKDIKKTTNATAFETWTKCRSHADSRRIQFVDSSELHVADVVLYTHLSRVRSMGLGTLRPLLKPPSWCYKRQSEKLPVETLPSIIGASDVRHIPQENSIYLIGFISFEFDAHETPHKYIKRRIMDWYNKSEGMFQEAKLNNTSHKKFFPADTAKVWNSY